MVFERILVEIIIVVCKVIHYTIFNFYCVTLEHRIQADVFFKRCN